MFRMKHVSWAVSVVCAGGVATAAVAQQQQPQQSQQKLERVEITGSNIKRIDTETVAPVQVITREQIERSGQVTIADVLRNIPSNSGGSFGESFSNSFAPGAAGISLRGLGQKTTLVLLNGRRVAGYGFAQNLQDTFVDLNSIPASAVERVEVLKDGASAVYGSDAIAGVVNIILRRDFKGMEAAAGYGYAAGKPDVRANLTAGFGDLGADRFNVFGVLDFYKRDELLLSDTDFGASRDKRGEAGGRNFQSLTAGGTWRQLSATGALTNNFTAISECPNPITGPQAVEQGLLVPGSAQALATNTFCPKDINSQVSFLPGTQRIGFIGRGAFDLSANLSAYAEAGFQRNETEQTFTPPFFAGTTGLQPTVAGLRPFTYNANFAPGAAGNPFTSNARFIGNLQDFGTRDIDITSDTVRGLIGLKGAFGATDFDTALGFSKNKIDQSNINRISLSGTSAVLGIPTTPQPPIPLSTAPTINLDRPSLTSEAVRNQMRITFPREADSQLTFLDAKLSREFESLTLPGGPVAIAAGIDLRNEKLKDDPDPRAVAGDILGQGITATNAKRTSKSAYTEVRLLPAKSLELQLAARHDRYSDYGTTTTPKVGLKWTPNSFMAIRANWGKGFRAPTLPEITPSVATFFIQVNDPVTGQNGVQVSGVFAGNPNLRPETSISKTLGVVLEPDKNFNVSIDLYDIQWNNIVAADSFQGLVNAGDPRVIRDPSTNNIVTILNNYRNLTSTTTHGVDIDGRLTVPTELGKLQLGTQLSYIDSFKEDGVEFAGTNGGTNTIPRWRGSASIGWDSGAWDATFTANYIHGYQQQLLAASFFAPQDPRFQTGVYPDKIRSHSEYDITARYRVTPNLTLTGSVLNMLNTKPPYDPGFSATLLYDFSQYDVRGREYRVAVRYKFF
jgi:iron complex outermembrane recepter protein